MKTRNPKKKSSAKKRPSSRGKKPTGLPAPADELRNFHDFLGEHLKKGAVDWSPEEALDEWRRSQSDDQASAEDCAAIQEALDDLAKGDRGVLFEDFDRDFRRRHNLPSQT